MRAAERMYAIKFPDRQYAGSWNYCFVRLNRVI